MQKFLGFTLAGLIIVVLGFSLIVSRVSSTQRATTSSTAADIGISVQNPSLATIGASITYRDNVLNTGNTPASGVTLADYFSLPPNATFVSSSLPCTVKGNAVTCTLGTVNPGNAISVYISYKVTTAMLNCPGTVNHYATITSINLDSNPANNGTPLSPVEVYCNAAPLPSYPSLPRGDYTYTITSGGIQRSYLVYVPSTYHSTNPTPVILNYHGGGSNAPAQEIISQMDATADKDGFLVVFPQGTGPSIGGQIAGTWNAGNCCSTAQASGIDDVGFTKAILADLEKKFNVDTKRIFATGYSNGGMMAYELACDMSNTFAAIGVVAGDLVDSNCKPSRPVPLLHIHGTSDPCVPYNGGNLGGCLSASTTSVTVPSAIADTSQWAAMNGCSSITQTIYQKGDATCVRYGSNCKNGAVAELCSIQNGGHTWPGGVYAPVCTAADYRSLECQLVKKTLGALDTEFSADDALWSFFSVHPMP